MPRTWPGLYAAWFGRVLQGDFGHSVRSGLPVLPRARARRAQHALPHARRARAHARHRARRSRCTPAHGDTPAIPRRTLAAYVLSAVPVFWLGYIVVYVFIHQFGMFPLISGRGGSSHAWLYALVPISCSARQRHALGDHPPPARGALAACCRGLHPHRAGQGRAGAAATPTRKAS